MAELERKTADHTKPPSVREVLRMAVDWMKSRVWDTLSLEMRESVAFAKDWLPLAEAALERPEQQVSKLSLGDMQRSQPWTVPYSSRFEDAASAIRLPYLYATHAVMHAAKSVGKLAAVFEALDHRDSLATDEENKTIQAMSADLVTAAMRLANLGSFDLETVLRERVLEKNGVGFTVEPEQPVKDSLTTACPGLHLTDEGDVREVLHAACVFGVSGNQACLDRVTKAARAIAQERGQTKEQKS